MLAQAFRGEDGGFDNSSKHDMDCACHEEFLDIDVYHGSQL